MKILEVIPALSSGGAERFVVDLCNQMSMDGNEVTLLTMKKFSLANYGFYKDEVIPRVKIINLGLGKFNFSTFWKVFKEIKRAKCDVVHMHLSGSTFFGVLAILFDKTKKFVVTCHNQPERDQNELMRYVLKKFCLKHHLLEQVAISHQNAESIGKVYSLPPIKLIYNGRATVGASKEFEKTQKEVAQYKNTASTLVFTIIARCNPEKNIPKLIRCFNQLIDSGKNVTLLVIGNGYDSSEISSVLEEANSNIHFLGQKHNIADYLLCSDFFTLSSDSEGMPMTLIEALACGCIPVGTPVSGFNDVIEDGKTGFVAKNFRDDGYLDALNRAIIHKNDISRDKLKELYVKKLSMTACAKEYEKLFEAVITNK